MQSGDPYTMIVEEIIESLKEIGLLGEYAAEVTQNSDDKDSVYALAWYMFNLRQYKEHLIQIAFVLGGKGGRPVADFYKYGESVNLPSYQITLHDLKSQHIKVNQQAYTTQLAYRGFINENRPIDLLFRIARRQHLLMDWCLNQAMKTS